MEARLIFEANGVCVSRSGRRVVADVEMLIEPNTWIGLIGANGSGKTTLIRALSGRIPTDSGRIFIGREGREGDRIFRAESIGLAPDVHDLPPSLSGNEYLRLMSRRDADRDADLRELAAALDFHSFANRPLGELSAGMKQRIAIYSAFINDSKLIFLDEPFNWLDPVAAYRTKQALRDLTRTAGYTFLTALHDMATFTVYRDKGFLMSGGRIARVLDREQLAAGSRNFEAFEAEIIQTLV